MTPKTLIRRYAAPVAVLSGAAPAKTLAELVDQLGDASTTADLAGVPGCEDLDDAAVYLADAQEATGLDQDLLLRQAHGRLRCVADMADDYQLMI